MTFPRNPLLLCLAIVVMSVLALITYLMFVETPVRNKVNIYYAKPDFWDMDRSVKESSNIPDRKKSDEVGGNKSESSINVNDTFPEVVEDDQGTLYKMQIVDALGESIPSGVIMLATKEYSFSNGEFIFPEVSLESVTATVSAEGYSPVIQSIHFEQNTHIKVELEYVSHYELQVYMQDQKTSCPDAEVLIWKADNTLRPVPSEQKIRFINGDELYDQAIVSIRQGECVFMNIPIDVPSFLTTITHSGRSHPIEGDKIYSVGWCKWDKNQNPQFKPIPEIRYLYDPIKMTNSNKLRIWDTLYFSRIRMDGIPNTYGEKIEFSRDFIPAYCTIEFPNFPKGLTPIESIITDKNGRCSFSATQPALYYAGARYKNSASSSIPLHPASGGGKLILDNVSQVNIHVKREGKGSRYPFFQAMKDVDVIVKSKNNSGVFMDKTDQSGGVKIDSVPYGEYQLYVKPDDASPHQEDIDINQPFIDKHVYLENWRKTTISGQVVHIKTKKPISNYRLSLLCMDPIVVYQDSLITNDDGKFTFEDVIPGSYQIVDNISSLVGLQYLANFESSSYYMLLDSIKKDGFAFSGHPEMIKVGSEPIINVLFFVTDVVSTHFSGKVTNTKGEPIPGAKVAVSYKNPIDEGEGLKELWVSSEQSVTDLEGLFKFAIYGCDFPMDLQFEISASEGYKVLPSFSLPDKDGMYYYVDEYYRVERSGVVTFIGGTGKSYSDLHITMDDKSNRTVYIKLLSDDMMDERSVSLKVSQNSIHLRYQYMDNGDYKIEGVNPGLLKLYIIPYIKNNIVTPYDIHVSRKYLQENIDFDILDNEQDEIYVEIPLRKSGYLWGVVADTNNTPVHQVLVSVNGEPYNDRISITDERGYFFIDDLSMEDKFSLKCLDCWTSEQIFQQTDIIPNQEGINIQLGK